MPTKKTFICNNCSHKISTDKDPNKIRCKECNTKGDWVEKKPALCEVCCQPVKKKHAVLIKGQNIPDAYKKHLPYKKLRHEHCFICIVCKQPVSERNAQFIGSSQYGLVYCKDSCYIGSPMWMESEHGKSSPVRRYYEGNHQESRAAAIQKKKVDIIEKVGKEHKAVPLLEQLNKTKDKKERQTIRRQLRKQGIYISNLRNEKAHLKSSKKKNSSIKSKKEK